MKNKIKKVFGFIGRNWLFILCVFAMVGALYYKKGSEDYTHSIIVFWSSYLLWIVTDRLNYKIKTLEDDLEHLKQLSESQVRLVNKLENRYWSSK